MRTALVRIAAAAIVGILWLPASADLASATRAYGTLLTRYVTPRGVRYEAWRTSGPDLKTLSEVVMVFRSTETGPLAADERKALHINLYNAKVLEMVLLGNASGSIKELSHGVSPLEIFSRIAFAVDGKGMSLNDLEKSLRQQFKDPRIHFALNCASKSCPPIRAEPYTASEVNTQLDDATRAFLASPEGVTVRAEKGKTTIVASKIFDWYADDFKVSGGTAAFIAKYGPDAARDAVAGKKAKLAFSDYDWSLNAAK